MVSITLKQWLTRESLPRDFYELIGQPRLTRDHAQLSESFEAATEYLFNCQNHHQDKTTRERARALTRILAEARLTIADAQRWNTYDQAILAELREQYFCKGPTETKLDRESLGRWLALVQKVDQNRIESIVNEWLTTAVETTNDSPLVVAEIVEEEESPPTDAERPAFLPVAAVLESPDDEDRDDFPSSSKVFRRPPSRES